MIIQHEHLNFGTGKAYFEFPVDETNITKFLKLIYKTREEFQENFINYFKKYFHAYGIEYFNFILETIDNLWDNTKPFSYREAFEISDNNFRIKVFSHININEMIETLGTTRVKVEGKETINKVWDENKQEFVEVPLTLIYELHHVNGKELGIDSNKLPVIKCWCTSTNKEHWLWCNPENIKDNSPLSAVASTCCIYESMKGKIKHIIRHGDVFLFEMIEEVIPSDDERVIHLTAEEYFTLLKSQS